MAILLIILGVLSVIAGLGMITYGIPVKEFSLGNTLILAGTTAVVGGLIVIGVGLAVRQLRRIAEMLAIRPFDIGHPDHAGHAEYPDHAPELPSVLAPTARRPATKARISFPLKPGTRPEPAEATDAKSPLTAPVVPPVFPPAADMRPSLEAPLAADDRDHDFESVRRVEPVMAPEPENRPLADVAAGPAEESERSEPAGLGGLPRGSLAGGPSVPLPQAPGRPPWLDAAGHAAPGAFDSAWNAPSKSPSTAAGAETGSRNDELAPDIARALPTSEEVAQEESRSVAILKSGVIDGMGYTLYVDGSIEAELPQGTVRFESIAELREHLEKNS